MLQKIRDQSQGWITVVIVGLLVVAFAMWGVHSYMSSGGSTDMAAKVNGTTIQTSIANTAYERLRQQQQMQLGADFVMDPKVEMQLKKQALDQLIMEQILAQAAYKDGFRVFQEEVDAALLRIPAFQVNGRFSQDRFNEVVGSILYNEKTFLMDLQTSLLINQVRSGYINTAFALPNDVEAGVRLVNQKRDLGYLIIPAARYVKNAQASDSDAQKYYQQHKDQFMSPEQVSVEYLQLSLPQLTAQLQFSDAQLQQFYQDNLSNYTQPQRWHVAQILVRVPPNASAQQIAEAKAKISGLAQRIAQGEDFAKLAQQYSDDRITARNGGEMDWFSVGMVDPNLEKAVTLLKQANDVTPVVQTRYGFSLAKLLEVQKPQITPFAKVRPQVEKALSQQQAERQFADASDKLSNLTYSNPTSLDVAAKALGLQVKTSDLFDKNGGKDQVTSNAKIIAAAFSSDVLQGNNSDVLEMSPDNLVVIRIKQHKAAALRSYAEVRDQVMEKLKLQLAQQQAHDIGQKFQQALVTTKNPAAIAAQDNLAWKVANDVGRFGSQAPATILAAAFRMPHPADGKPSVKGFALPNGDYAVIAVNAVHEGSFNRDPKVEQRIYGEELENSYGQLDYAMYVRGLVNKAKVVTSKGTADTAKS